MAFTKIANTADLPEGTAAEVTVNGKTLAVFHVAGKYYALDAQCTHRAAPLAEGECEGTEVVCPWHGARFDLQTGEAKSRPASRGVTSYPVQIVGDEIQIDV